MRNPTSEIFEQYVKAAEEKGWVKEGDYAIVRAGEDSTETIEMLYGVKPNGKDDDVHIVDKAHPETAVIIPAHDKFNSIVENIKQRQNMMAYIALKTPGGHLTQHRYVTAQDELTKSLVRIGFMLDNKDETELMKLADSCTGLLQKKAVVPAAGAVAMLGPIGWSVLGVVALLGTLAVINRTDDSKQTVIQNSERALRELEDLRGHAAVDGMIKDIRELQLLATSFEPIKVEVLNAREVIEAAKENKPALEAAQKYLIKLQRVHGLIPIYIKDLKASESGGYTYDWLQKIEDVGRTILSITTDTEDAVNALNGLDKAITDAMASAQHVMSNAQAHRETFAEELSNMEEQAPGVVPAAPEQAQGEGLMSRLVQKAPGGLRELLQQYK